MAVKESVSEQYVFMSNLIESIDFLYAAFINSKMKMVEEAEFLLEETGRSIDSATEDLVKLSKDDPSIAPYVSVPSHIGRMVGGTGRIALELRKKIKDGVLFSDRAISELEYLFERVRDIIVNTRDLILARNTLVARHIEEAEKAVVRSANDYATRHEERLIEGLCAPKASGIYLEILGAVKDIAWHAKGIARDLS